MAYWRGLSSRASIIARRKHHHPCLSHIPHDDNDVVSEPFYPSPNANQFLTQKRFFGSTLDHKVSSFRGFNQSRRISNALLLSPAGFGFGRNMSTATGGAVPEALLEAMNEVAIAAADSFLPVKVLIELIDYVHTTAGLNWWAAIVVTTLLIESCTASLLLMSSLKESAKLLLMKPHLDELNEELKSKGMDDVGAMMEYKKKFRVLFKDHGCTIWAFSAAKLLRDHFIQSFIFISFILAILNMAKKVPSFKDGGAYWFIDLTTPDHMYIFPVLGGLTFLILVESNLHYQLESMEGPMAKTMKNLLRPMAVLTVPCSAFLPKAVFCYWVTLNLFALGYGIVLQHPFVRKTLGLPDMLPPTPAPPGFQRKK